MYEETNDTHILRMRNVLKLLNSVVFYNKYVTENGFCRTHICKLFIRFCYVLMSIFSITNL